MISSIDDQQYVSILSDSPSGYPPHYTEALASYCILFPLAHFISSRIDTFAGSHRGFRVQIKRYCERVRYHLWPEAVRLFVPPFPSFGTLAHTVLVSAYHLRFRTSGDDGSAVIHICLPYLSYPKDSDIEEYRNPSFPESFTPSPYEERISR